MCDIIDKVQLYLEHQNIESEVCRIYMRKIDHLYYKFDPLVLKQKKVTLYKMFIFQKYIFYNSLFFSE